LRAVKRLAWHWLEYATLWTLGLCLPVFQDLDNSPDYLVAAQAGFPDLVLVTLGLVVIPPTVALGIEALARRIDERAGRLSHLALLALFVAIGAMQAFKGELDPRRRSILVGAVLIGALFAYLYSRGSFLRQVLAVLSPTIVLVLVWFLGLSSASSRAWGADFPEVEQTRANGTPVVLVIFDEFSGVSLLDGRGRISARYPAFRRLAREATWYRNATTVADVTGFAVPALLAGNLEKRKEERKLPTASDYPRNLFSLLRGQYRMNVHEAVTDLCGFCPDRSWHNRLDTLADGYWELIRPRLEPRKSPKDALLLPPEALENRDRTWREWEAGIRGGATLNVLHVELPHEPWVYDRQGREVSDELGVPGNLNDTWVGTPAEVADNYRRYLGQVAYMDTLVGQLRERLDPIWDDALVVLVADHGVAFEPKQARRAVTKANLPEIASVPLFVKAPGQRRGHTSDELARITDVFPTIGDWLGTGWKGEGQSLRRPVHRDEVSVYSLYGWTIKAKLKEFELRRAFAMERLATQAGD
jgi:Sulfatase